MSYITVPTVDILYWLKKNREYNLTEGFQSLFSTQVCCSCCPRQMLYWMAANYASGIHRLDLNENRHHSYIPVILFVSGIFNDLDCWWIDLTADIILAVLLAAKFFLRSIVHVEVRFRKRVHCMYAKERFPYVPT